MTRALMLAMLAVLVAGAGPATKPSGHHHGGAPGDGVTSFDVYVDGPRVHLLTVHAFSSISNGAPRAYELRYQRSTDGGASWSQPALVGRGQPPPEIAKRGMDVQIAAAGDRLIAAWTAKGTKDKYGRGALVTAISSDGGQTWRAGPDPADDGNPDLGRAFIDVAADNGGALHLVWLDGRGGEGKGLIYARSMDGGATWSKNFVLDAACCECCWNAVTCAPDGKIYVLYRDIAPRDMSIVRSDDSGNTWSTPATVGRFGWNASVCPHVGGALVVLTARASKQSLHAVVWTGRESASGAYAMSSVDDGATWTDPQPLGGPGSGAWHTDIASHGDLLAAVWDAYTESGTTVFAATSTDAGRSWSTPARLSAEQATATHPRVIACGDSFRAIWTEQRPAAATTLVVKLLSPDPRGAP